MSQLARNQVWSDLALLEGCDLNAISTAREKASQVVLPAMQRELPQVIAVERQDVEGIELHLVVVLAAVQAIGVCDAVDPKENSLAIENELLHLDPKCRLDDHGIAAAPVIAVTCEQAHPIA